MKARLTSMSTVKIADTSELKSGEKKKIIVDSKAILLVNIEGKFYAVDNTCTHMGGDLSLGNLEGSNIVCPRHHAMYDVTNGKAVKDGKLLFMNAKVHDLKGYPIKVEGNQILIDLT
jgi:3-phenylpropionate/trans-cinnamate dioxygenase ferredoxin subunit